LVLYSVCPIFKVLRREYHAKLAIAIALQLKAARHPASHSGFLAKIDLRLAQTDIFKLPITILTSSLDSATPVSRKRAEFGDQRRFRLFLLYR